MVNFTAKKTEILLINKIAKRAVKLNPEYDYMDCQMDISACHSNGNPIDLKKLLKADDFNFAHDVFGINRHINRETGKLKDFFLPRASK